MPDGRVMLHKQTKGWAVGKELERAMSSEDGISYAGCCINYYKYDSGKNEKIATQMVCKKECEGASQRAYRLRERKIYSQRDRKSAAGTPVSQRRLGFPRPKAVGRICLRYPRTE